MLSVFFFLIGDRLDLDLGAFCHMNGIVQYDDAIFSTALIGHLIVLRLSKTNMDLKEPILDYTE